MRNINWKLPENWELPENEEFFQLDTLYTMTKSNFNIVQKYLKNTRVALDVGAHIGTTAVRYAKHFETVHAFEPVYYEILKRNVKHLNNVIIHPVAASDKVENHIMHRSKRNSGCTLIKTASNAKILKNSRFSKKEIPVNCRPIDSLNLTNVDFIKMDTEGFVLPVLQGMTETIRSNHPFLMIEFNNLCFNRRECVNYIKSLGYQKVDHNDVDDFFEWRKVAK